MTAPLPKILFIEPFYGGSHKSLIDTLTSDHCLITLPAKKWHWRARCSALILKDLIPKITSEKVLFCSSVLNLTELLGLRPDLGCLKKVVYFHENQLIYPVQEIKERDIQYSYNQLTTCLVADLVLFNSNFNKASFLDNIRKILKILPDHKPKNLRDLIEPKCRVLYFPVTYPQLAKSDKSTVLHIVWPHRWEFDKNPEAFFKVLFKLKEAQIPFKASILGEHFTDNPEIFSTAREILKDEITHFGYVESKADYYGILARSHVVVSTAKHEFFGVAMLEAAYLGCFPLAPNHLVYPEIYPPECLFESLEELYEKLKGFCLNPNTVSNVDVNFGQYSSENVVCRFMEEINRLLL